MNQPDSPRARYGRERLCPHCGTRVAQRAQTCFSCGGTLERAPRARRGVPWADLVLFSVIGGLVFIWWTRSPGLPDGRPLSLLALRTSSPAGAAFQTPAADLATELLVEAPPTATAPAPELAPAPTGTPTASVTVNPGPVRHKVARGDTLLAIAALYKSTVKDIADTNGIRADAVLQIGQELVIPVPGPSGGPGPTSTPGGGALMYTVQAGDTLLGLATRFGSELDWILQANNMKAGDILHISQPLLIPLSGNTPTPTPTETPAPSPTPTVRSLSFRAPELLSPADGEIASSADGMLLSWTSTGTLAENQSYVVTVWRGEDKSPTITYWTRSSSWRLPAEYRTAHAAPVDFRWQVQVRSGTPDGSSEALSLPSAPRRFTWQ